MTQEIKEKEKKKHEHVFEAARLLSEIWDDDSPRYIVVEYWCPPDDEGNDCPDQATEKRVLGVDAP